MYNFQIFYKNSYKNSAVAEFFNAVFVRFFCAQLYGFLRCVALLFFVVAVVFALFRFHYVNKKYYAHKHDKPDQNPHFVGVEKDLHLFPKRLCLSDFFLKIFDCVADCGQCDFFHYSSTRISAATFFTPSRAVISFNAFSMIFSWLRCVTKIMSVFELTFSSF